MVTLVEHFLATVKHFFGEPTKPQEFQYNKKENISRHKVYIYYKL